MIERQVHEGPDDVQEGTGGRLWYPEYDEAE
jgi:hypothetical protein